MHIRCALLNLDNNKAYQIKNINSFIWKHYTIDKDTVPCFIPCYRQLSISNKISIFNVY